VTPGIGGRLKKSLQSWSVLERHTAFVTMSAAKKHHSSELQEFELCGCCGCLLNRANKVYFKLGVEEVHVGLG